MTRPIDDSKTFSNINFGLFYDLIKGDKIGQGTQSSKINRNKTYTVVSVKALLAVADDFRGFKHKLWPIL